MSSLLFRSPSITPPAHPNRRWYARRIAVDASVDPITTAAIKDRWSTLQLEQPDRAGDVDLVVDRAVLAASRVVADHEAWAWADLVLRSLARETNTLLASTRVLLVGGGDVAEALATALSRLGSRVELASGDAIELAAAARRHAVIGHYIGAQQFISADIDVVIATGVHHLPITPPAVARSDRTLVVVDGAPPWNGQVVIYRDEHAAGTVRNLTQFDGPRPVFVVPAVDQDELDRAAAGVRAAYAVLLATVGPDDADIELAKALLT